MAIQGSDLLYCLLIAALPALIAAVLARRLSWARRKILLVSAIPIPALMALLCIWFSYESANAPPERCGVDACGMMIAASVTGLILAALTFVAGFGFAALGYFVGRR